jgi:hypothetical protein
MNRARFSRTGSRLALPRTAFEMNHLHVKGY